MAALLTKYNVGTTILDLVFVITLRKKIPAIELTVLGCFSSFSEMEMFSVSVATV